MKKKLEAEIFRNNWCKEVIKSSGMTTSAFAAWLGAPERTVKAWLSGNRMPPKYVIDLIIYKLEKEREDTE